MVVVPVAGWIGVGVMLHYIRIDPSVVSEGTVVVVPPLRPVTSTPPPSPPVPQPVHVIPPAGDRSGLVRELQRELRRVGCYDGEISGVWSVRARRAMRDFTESVNARLPIEEPDNILLRLVQGHSQKACGAQSADAGQPARDVITAQVASEPAGERSVIVTGSTAATAGAVAALSRPAVSPAAEMTKPRLASAEPANSAQEHRSAHRSQPLPRVGIYERHRRHAARRARSRPPAVVRSVVRGLQRALASVGIN
jgi:peptidoglycan hydrolase-like protein with peptidoglycan-binding domain